MVGRTGGRTDMQNHVHSLWFLAAARPSVRPPVRRMYVRIHTNIYTYVNTSIHQCNNTSTHQYIYFLCQSAQPGQLSAESRGHKHRTSLRLVPTVGEHAIISTPTYAKGGRPRATIHYPTTGGAAAVLAAGYTIPEHQSGLKQCFKQRYTQQHCSRAKAPRAHPT